MPHDDTVSYSIIEYQCINSIFSGGVFDVDISSPSTHPPVLPIPTGPQRSRPLSFRPCAAAACSAVQPFQSCAFCAVKRRCCSKMWQTARGPLMQA